MADGEDGEDPRGLVGRRWGKGLGDCGLVDVAEEDFHLEKQFRSIDFSFTRRFSCIRIIDIIESASSESHIR